MLGAIYYKFQKGDIIYLHHGFKSIISSTLSIERVLVLYIVCCIGVLAPTINQPSSVWVYPELWHRGHEDTERQNYLLQSSLEADSRSGGPGSCSQSLDVSCRHLPAPTLRGGYSSIFSGYHIAIDLIKQHSSPFRFLAIFPSFRLEHW